MFHEQGTFHLEQGKIRPNSDARARTLEAHAAVRSTSRMEDVFAECLRDLRVAIARL